MFQGVHRPIKLIFILHLIFGPKSLLGNLKKSIFFAARIISFQNFGF